jgi:AAA15 family ATPase/GTPase
MGEYMRLRAFEIKNYGPIRAISVSDLANIVVFAGPNGVGKNNIMTALLRLSGLSVAIAIKVPFSILIAIEQYETYNPSSLHGTLEIL